MTFHHSVEKSLLAFAFVVYPRTNVKLTKNRCTPVVCVCETPVSKDLGPDATCHKKQGGTAL